MRRTGLQGLAVLHHGLDAESIEGSGETLVLRLVAYHYRQGHVGTGEVSIDLHHPLSLLHRFLSRGVGRVSLLPQELGGTEEKAGPHLPTHHIGPLIDQYGQIPV